MPRTFTLLVLAILFGMLHADSSPAQTLDFVEYVRYENPPQYADFIEDTTGTPDHARVVFTKDYSYHGSKSLKIERLEGTPVPTKSMNSLFMDYDAQNFYFLGFIYVDDKMGSVDLTFSPRVPVSRAVVVGATATKETETKVPVGPFLATAKVKATVAFVALETVETPLGRFENALRTDTIVSLTLQGLELASDKRTEWYHPLVGVVQIQDQDTGALYKISKIEPPVDLPVRISDWRNF